MTSWKRGFDVCGALGGLIFFGPLMLSVAGAILLDDGRPVLFRQARLGRGRRTFEIVKFRSMRDGRVTRTGRWLRATGLDELPQFLNILRGELSAVGPRPITEDDAARYGWLGPSAAPRWRVQPGLTGLGQLAGRCPRESLGLDRCYVRRRSLALDCRLIAMSFVVNALGKSRARRLFFRRSGWLRQVPEASADHRLCRQFRLARWPRKHAQREGDRCHNADDQQRPSDSPAPVVRQPSGCQQTDACAHHAPRHGNQEDV